MRVESRWSALLLVMVLLSSLAVAHDKKASENKAAGKAGGAEGEIRKLDEQMRQAALKSDASFLEKHLAADYIGVSPEGREANREQSIQMRKSGAVKYDAIDVKDTKVRVYGNTAIVNHEALVKGTSNGQPFSMDGRATFVWVNQGGKWKVASFQVTPVQATASAAAAPQK
ncbi:MAG: nuclear transport factor 2 family protein [Terriglobales bacterium]